MFGNQKVVGSFLIGVAFVFGSYLLTHFGHSSQRVQTANTPAAAIVAVDQRQYIPVTDKDNNGIEDWREEFVSKTALILDQPGSSTIPYTVPDTLTDQVGIQLFQAIMRAKEAGAAGPSQADIINTTTERLQSAIKDVIYKNADAITIPVSPEAIRTYANTIAQIVVNNNIKDTEGELDILNRAVNDQNTEELKKLIPLATMYKNMRDQTLATPVPVPLLKQHLDLINVFEALYASLTDMQLVFTDPVVTLLRIKRYQDDATGLVASFQNMYTAILPYAAVFQPDDPAILFVQFDPNYHQ